MPSSKKTKKKTSKASASRFSIITGGVKKLSRVKQGYLAMVALLLVTSFGYAGYGYMQEREWQAQAAGSTRLVHDVAYYPETYGCKIFIKAYGGINVTRIHADRSQNRAGNTASMILRVSRKGTPVDTAQRNFSSRNSKVSADVNASGYLNDAVYIRFKRYGNWKQFGPYYPNFFKPCY